MCPNLFFCSLQLPHKCLVIFSLNRYFLGTMFQQYFLIPHLTVSLCVSIPPLVRYSQYSRQLIGTKNTSDLTLSNNYWQAFNHNHGSHLSFNARDILTERKLRAGLVFHPPSWYKPSKSAEVPEHSCLPK